MEVSLKDLRDLLVSDGPTEASAYEVGKAYFIQTATIYVTGRIARITADALVLDDAAWIADTGRFADAMKSGTFSEVEPYANTVIIPRASIIAAQVWTHALPRDQK